MAIIQCEQNHYYDNTKNDICPYCQKLGDDAAVNDDDSLREQQTVFMATDTSSDEGQKTEMYGEMVGEGDKTISIFFGEAENLFTVGWLVCISGPVKGKSYTIHSGRNFAGRDLNMDIVLSDDLLLSREKHFSIIYEPKKNEFYIIAGVGRTFINDKHLESDSNLIEGDRIMAGESEYIFIPFCKEGRTWASKE